MRIGLIDSGKGGLYYSIYNNIESPFLIMDKAYFPYGNKTKEFLIKRTIYLIDYLSRFTDRIVLACNTLSLVVLPFVRLIFSNVYGVFETVLPYIKERSLVIGSGMFIKEFEKLYPNVYSMSMSGLIYKLENNIDYEEEVQLINSIDCENVVLCCTHFICIDTRLIEKPCIKNKLPNKILLGDCNDEA